MFWLNTVKGDRGIRQRTTELNKLREYINDFNELYDLILLHKYLVEGKHA